MMISRVYMAMTLVVRVIVRCVIVIVVTFVVAVLDGAVITVMILWL